jgi:hypothetical protein
LHDPRGDQRPRRGREPAEQRRAAEHRHAGDEHPAPADEVTQPPAQQQEAAVDDRVGAHDPLEVTRREADITRDVRQRDVHHAVVERGDQRAERQQGQAPGGRAAGPGG